MQAQWLGIVIIVAKFALTIIREDKHLEIYDKQGHTHSQKHFKQRS